MEPDIEENGESSDSDVEGVQLTLAQAMQLMQESWQNEKFAPEILQNNQELVDILLGQVTTMEENIESLSSSDFQKVLYQMEVDRLRFLITSYLRIRLEKIENYVYAILHEENARVERGDDLYLTNDELEFAKSYKQAMEEHFEEILKFWRGMTPDDWKNDPVVPNLNSYVFVKSKSEIKGVVIDENYVADFEENGKMLISYKSISQFIKTGEVNLI